MTQWLHGSLSLCCCFSRSLAFLVGSEDPGVAVSPAWHQPTRREASEAVVGVLGSVDPH